MLSYKSRVQGFNVWTNLVFVLNGIVFLLIGLQLPSIVEKLGETSLNKAIWYGLTISLVLVITRILCTLGAVIFTRFMSRFITVADANPGWKGPIILGWGGMRGVVSLAMALSIPLLINGQAFPYRNLSLHHFYCYTRHFGFPGTYSSMGDKESETGRKTQRDT